MIPTVTRRAALVGAATLGVAGEPARAAQNSKMGKPRLSVNDFVSRDGDLGRAVLAAVAHLPSRGGAVLHIPPGTYHFQQSTDYVISLIDIHDVEIEARQANFLFHGSVCPIIAKGCSNLSIRGGTIDWGRPPFSQGDVINTSQDNLAATIKIDAEFPITGSESVIALATYDRASGLMTKGGIDDCGAVASLTKMDNNLIRLTFRRPLGLRVGQTIVLRHPSGSAPAIEFRNCSDIIIEDLSIFTAPGMGVVARACRNISIRRLRVAKSSGSGRLMSTCADATHFSNCEGKIEISDTEMEGMGDDCINVPMPYLRITKRVDARTFEVTNFHNSAIGPGDVVPAGHKLSFTRVETMEELGEAEVATSLDGIVETIRIEGTPLFEIGIGDLLMDISKINVLQVVNCRFPGNRARGILAHANATIANCYFGNQFGSAILLAVDATWLEGGPARHVQINDNTFEGVGRRDNKVPTIAIDVRGPSGLGVESERSHFVNSDIKVIHNDFRKCLGPIVEGNNVSSLHIISNTIEPASDPAIVLHNVADVLVSNNRCQPHAAISYVLSEADAVILRGNIGFEKMSLE